MHDLGIPTITLGIIVALWVIPWKVYAVWLAAKHDNKMWFVVLLFLNTLAILEIYYIFKVAKKSYAEVKADFRSVSESFRNKNKVQ
ncbi:MAG: hypothetical protein KBD17_02225 [Candidatus Pacebacteria bacterium]|nr:hypothetical protein [Candidatus Paceibacterota bacterium]